MNDNEECDCLKEKNCCKCGKILEKKELKARTNPYAEDICNDYSEHLLCYECSCFLANDV